MWHWLSVAVHTYLQHPLHGNGYVKKVALGVLLAAVILPTAATAQRLTVVNVTHIPVRQIRKAKRAMILQVRQMRRYWPGPQIRFGRGGWKIRLVSVGACGCWGYHSTRRGVPYAVVGRDYTRAWHAGRAWPMWESSFSHEILEMLVDPYSYHPEICDPAESKTYLIDGFDVQAFVTPSGHRIASYP